MKRRQFLGLASAAAASWPLLAHSQQSVGLRKIGVLMARKIADPEGQKQVDALRQGLAALGWSAGQSVQIEERWTVGDPANALEYARELVGMKPDVLVANATPSLIALRQVAGAIPVVFVSVADPVGQGFVPSLSRPGGNITGFSVEEASMGGKWLEILKEVSPPTARIAIIYNPATAPYAPMFFPAMQAAAPRMGVTLSIAPVTSAAEMEKIIMTTGRESGGGLIVLPDSFMFGQRALIIALTAKHRLPTVYPIRFFVTDGGLIAYGIDRVDLFSRAAAYVDRILRGASPGELPVQQPTKFELAINVKNAKALGLAVPQSLLLSADEVIE